MILRFLIITIIITGLAISCRDAEPKLEPNVHSVEKIKCKAENRIIKSVIEAQMRCAGLVEVRRVCPEIEVLLRYSSTNNVWKTDLYGNLNNAYLQPVAIQRLALAQKLLNEEHPGYRLLIWDAARPVSVQQEMWDKLDVPIGTRHWYVANPQRGSLHNYGMAVDLTILDNNGKLLDMGTDFDHFGHPAYSSMETYYEQTGQLTSTQATNRRYLANLMRRAGFSPSSTEWWHYNACSIGEAKAKYKAVQ